MTLIHKTPVSNRIGIAKEKYNTCCDFDADNAKIAELVKGGKL